MEHDQAAALLTWLPSLFSTPSTKRTPAITFARCPNPFNRRKVFSAVSANLNMNDNMVARVTQPFARSLRWRIVAKADSIGLVVRRCTQ